MAYTILGSTRSDGTQSNESWCPLCQEADHRVGRCALQMEPSMSSSKVGPSRTAKSRPFSRYDPLGEVYTRFNRGLCTSPTCKYRHICKQCHKEHPWLSSPRPWHSQKQCRRYHTTSHTRREPNYSCIDTHYINNNNYHVVSLLYISVGFLTAEQSFIIIGIALMYDTKQIYYINIYLYSYINIHYKPWKEVKRYGSVDTTYMYMCIIM